MAILSRLLLGACVLGASALSAVDQHALQPAGNASSNESTPAANASAGAQELNVTASAPAKSSELFAPTGSMPNVGLPVVTIPGVDNTGCLAMDVNAAMSGITSGLSGITLFIAEFMNVFIFGASVFVACTGKLYARPAVGIVAFIAGYQIGSMALNQYSIFAANINEMAATACTATKSIEQHVSFDVSPCDFALPYEPCYTPLVGAILLGLLATAAAMCLLDWVVFILGAAVGVVVVGQLKELMIMFAPAMYAQWTMNCPYWAIAAAFGLLGGLVAKWREGDIFLIATAIVGAFGAMFSFASVLALYGLSFPQIGDEIVFGVIALTGFIVQCKCLPGGEKKKEVVEKVVEKKEDA